MRLWEKGPARKPTAIIVRGFGVPFRPSCHCGPSRPRFLEYSLISVASPSRPSFSPFIPVDVTSVGSAKVGLMAPQGTRQLAEKTIPVAKSVRGRGVGQRFLSNLLFRLGFSLFPFASSCRAFLRTRFFFGDEKSTSELLVA